MTYCGNKNTSNSLFAWASRLRLTKRARSERRYELLKQLTGAAAAESGRTFWNDWGFLADFSCFILFFLIHVKIGFLDQLLPGTTSESLVLKKWLQLALTWPQYTQMDSGAVNSWLGSTNEAPHRRLFGHWTAHLAPKNVHRDGVVHFFFNDAVKSTSVFFFFFFFSHVSFCRFC